MAYITQADITPDLPPDFLLAAIDDDNDGTADPDLWDAIATRSSEAVDAILSGRFTTPFPPSATPPIVKEATRIFALETLYRRRGYHEADTNPFLRLANSLRQRLEDIANGIQPLIPGIEKKGGSVSTVTEPARTSSPSGRLSV